MKIKLGDKVTWLGKEFTVTTIHPKTFAVLSLTDNEGCEEYLLRHYLDAFIKENSTAKIKLA